MRLAPPSPSLRSLRAWLPIAVGAVLWNAAAPAEAQRSRRWEKEEVQQAQFDVQPGGTLRVAVPDGNVVLETGDARKLEVRIELEAHDLEWAREIYDSMDWTVDSKGDMVSVRARKPRRERNWWSRHGGYGITVYVRLPEEFNVDLDTGDGNIIAERLRGRARLETSDGNIEVRSIEGPRVDIDTSDGNVEVGMVQSPNLRIETSDGTIVVESLNGDDASLRTSDGDIVVEEASGMLSATTGDGDIRVRLARFGATSLRTGDGDIYIDAPPDLKADLDLRGERLSLRKSSVRLDGSLSKTRARGALNGGGPRLSAVTRGGRIVFSHDTERGSR